MLTLRRAIVLAAADAGLIEPAAAPMLPATSAERPRRPLLRLELDVEGERRPAIADAGLVGDCLVGDEVIVNVQALDLELGSGGFDVVHVNLTRGLDRDGVADAHVMKLNYTSLQHAVVPVEQGADEPDSERAPLRALPDAAVAILALHGQLAPLAWALQQGAHGARVGYVQTFGGALPGALSDSVRELRARQMLAAHITAGASYGGEAEAITLLGALQHGFDALGWDAAICGPGPGLLGCASTFGHGGIAALDSAHGALALGCRALIVPRMSSGDARQRHRGLSHHTATVLELLLRPALVALPAHDAGGIRELPGDHEVRIGAADLDGYHASGLPAVTMGRGLREDPLFFAAALAAGDVLAGMIRGR